MTKKLFLAAVKGHLVAEVSSSSFLYGFVVEEKKVFGCWCAGKSFKLVQFA